ncbi:MAG: PDZ domain-containing protein [Planctomycetes bacterium]|nr:PDZ domain-containing protein [Planctomycetota bacterium]MCW8137046.1 PDZ domain-containing protein [Planctomycetota bacterium]
MHYAFRVSVPAFVFLLVAMLAVAEAQPRPPIPRPGRNPGMPGGSEGDYYNLGPIGGKATIERSPAGLNVQSVMSGSPAEKAGLQVGDIITGAPKAFGADPYHELGSAIEAAEAARKAKDAVVKLTVQRGGRSITVDVEVPCYGADAAKFPGGKMRDTIVDSALEFLAKEQRGDGGWDCHLSGENGRVVMTSLCGMAFLAAGHDAAKSKYKTNVSKAAGFVAANIGKESELGRMAGGGANWNQTNWGLGYGGIFLAEVQAASPQKGLDDKLKWVAETILKNMEDSGGFAHGPGGPNALNYLELEIVSNYCVAALGGAMANGVNVDKARIEKMLSYIQACGGGKGGVGYSTRPGQVGWGDCGRTGGAIMAFGAVGRDDHPYYKSMVGFMRGSLREIIDGHVSPTMHHLSAACACWREGKKAWEEYWAAQRQECTMLRCPDGSFTGRPTKESAQMGRNNDLDMGAVWNTAHWTIILCLEKDNLPVYFGKKGKAKPDPKAKEEKPKDPTTGEKKEAKPPDKKKPDIDEAME